MNEPPGDAPKKLLIIEPFYTGSHKVLIDLLSRMEVPDNYLEPHVATMTGKKWHWRARTSALHFAQTIPPEHGFVYKCVFTSSVLPLHELLALRPEFQKAKKIVYFHENQLVYPVRKAKDRDFQYGYNQIMSCLVADVIVFNSEFNKESFLSNLKSFFKLQPDYRPKNLRENIEPKCKVIYFPIDFEAIPRAVSLATSASSADDPVRIVWPHRWEFDKNPDMFFRVMMELKDKAVTNFRLSVLGDGFQDNPAIFSIAKNTLSDYILHWGFLATKADYYNVLGESDVVISTASHEFFGVAMAEAVYCGCYPLCPNALSYPEIFGNCHGSLYNDERELLEKLEAIIRSPTSFRCNLKNTVKVELTRYNWINLKNKFSRELYSVSTCSK